MKNQFCIRQGSGGKGPRIQANSRVDALRGARSLHKAYPDSDGILTLTDTQGIILTRIACPLWAIVDYLETPTKIDIRPRLALGIQPRIDDESDTLTNTRIKFDIPHA
jgi:hypothetical protein